MELCSWIISLLFKILHLLTKFTNSYSVEFLTHMWQGIDLTEMNVKESLIA